MNIQLDDTDIAILKQLQEDGRKPFSEIASILNVASNTIRNRVTRLREANLLQIIGWVDPLAVGYRAPAHIQIAIEPPSLTEAAAIALSELPEARFVAMITGEYPIMVDVRCRDQEHLTALITERIYNIEGVVRTLTNMYLHVYKYGPSKIEFSHVKKRNNSGTAIYNAK